MKILTVVGARPQFIKAATVSRIIQKEQGIEEILVHTGQHYDAGMSQVFFNELEIPEPKYNLGIGSLPHGAQTGRMLEALETVIQQEKPNWVLVYGDTNSTLAGALAAVKLHIPVGHVEAGLRSFNRTMPEEINRILTDHIASILFAPTETAVKHLHHEGIAQDKIHLVGDVMYDAALFYGEKAGINTKLLPSLELEPKQYFLATIHRAENTDDAKRLSIIMEGLKQLSTQMPIILPLHPRTKTKLADQNIAIDGTSNLRIIEPVGYLDMVHLEKQAKLIITDSGGVQKEAYFHGVPCAVLRDETEWQELVDLGWNILISPKSADYIYHTIDEFARKKFPAKLDLYGDGHSCNKIVTLLKES